MDAKTIPAGFYTPTTNKIAIETRGQSFHTTEAITVDGVAYCARVFRGLVSDIQIHDLDNPDHFRLARFDDYHAIRHNFRKCGK